MEEENPQLSSELEQKILHFFSDFMTRFAKYNELVEAGNRLRLGFQQELEFLRRPPIDNTSNLLEQIIIANETKRVQSYIKGGCMNTHDSVEIVNKLHTCLLGIWNNLNEGKSAVNELECLVEDVRVAIESDCGSGSLSNSQCSDIGSKLDLMPTPSNKEGMVSFVSPQHEVINYAAMMAVVYSMVKQDYIMQTSYEELAGYYLMWSLRPYINNEIINQAWRSLP